MDLQRWFSRFLINTVILSLGQTRPLQKDSLGLVSFVQCWSFSDVVMWLSRESLTLLAHALEKLLCGSQEFESLTLLAQALEKLVSGS